MSTVAQPAQPKQNGLPGQQMLPFDATQIAPANAQLAAAALAVPYGVGVPPAAAPVAAPVATPAAPAAAAPPQQRKEILQLLKEFAKQPGCERYAGDAEKVKLLGVYLWLRQLTPTLPFETFLECYRHVADFDEENLKHPDDAIAAHLPRNKKAAGEGRQWASKEVVDFVAVYVDMIREAEGSGQPIPMTLGQFISNPAIKDQYLAGAFAPAPAAPAPKAEKAPKAAKAATPKEIVRPTDGQRAIYTAPDNRQRRGTCLRVFAQELSQDGTRYYADFRSDAGEEFMGVALESFVVCHDPPPNQPKTDDGTVKQVLGTGVMLLKRMDVTNAEEALALTLPMGNVAVGSDIVRWDHAFDADHVARVCVANGDARPYVDAYLCHPSGQPVYFEVQPREHLCGHYEFEVANGVFKLEVRST